MARPKPSISAGDVGDMDCMANVVWMNAYSIELLRATQVAFGAITISMFGLIACISIETALIEPGMNRDRSIVCAKTVIFNNFNQYLLMADAQFPNLGAMAFESCV